MRYPSLKLFLIVIPSILSGCLVTRIDPREISAQVQRLGVLNVRPLHVRVDCPAPLTAGRQFLFVVIPFGRVELSDPGTMVLNTVTEKLALAGYQPRFDATGLPVLELRCGDITLAAYDFLFFRRLSGSVTLEGVLFDERGNRKRGARGSGKESELRSFAFGPQLERTFKRSLDEALTHVLDSLGLQTSAN